MLKRAENVERIIGRFKQELKTLGVNPEKVILYGSYAKGNPREDSDIDIIVVSDDFEGMNLRERLELLGLAAGRIFEPVEALGYTEKETKQCRETFLETVLNSSPVKY